VVCGEETTHSLNNAEVCKALLKLPSGKLGIGFVDGDKEKRQPDYQKKFTISKLKQPIATNVHIEVKKHPTNNHYLIISSKTMDRVAHAVCKKHLAGFTTSIDSFMPASKRMDRFDKTMRHNINTAIQAKDSDLKKLQDFLKLLSRPKAKAKKPGKKKR